MISSLRLLCAISLQISDSPKLVVADHSELALQQVRICNLDYDNVVGQFLLDSAHQVVSLVSRLRVSVNDQHVRPQPFLPQ